MHKGRLEPLHPEDRSTDKEAHSSRIRNYHTLKSDLSDRYSNRKTATSDTPKFLIPARKLRIEGCVLTAGLH
jgi:hypothetical protein